MCGQHGTSLYESSLPSYRRATPSTERRCTASAVGLRSRCGNPADDLYLNLIHDELVDNLVLNLVLDVLTFSVSQIIHVDFLLKL